MQTERRRTTRYNFGAIAEVIDLESRNDLVCVTRDLSLSGCFVKTKTPFPEGTEVRVRITSSGADFEATGNVTGNITWEGMGIEFVQIQPKHQAIIETWLGVISVRKDERTAEAGHSGCLIKAIPVIIFGQSSRGAFSEEAETRAVMPEGAVLRLSTAVTAGQVVRVKNRLTRMEQDGRVLFVGSPPEPDKPKLIAIEFLEPAQDFWRVERE